MKEDEPDKQEKKKPPIVIRNNTDLQRLKLDKLMKNPDKPVIIPEKPKERGVPTVPDFVRNVMGSSAGAGSGEFHVYRHLRRKEYARQKYMKEKGERERLETEYHDKIEENQRKAAERTEKKRLRRLKKKENLKKKAKKAKVEEESSESSTSETSEDEKTGDDADNEGKTGDDTDSSMKVVGGGEPRAHKDESRCAEGAGEEMEQEENEKTISADEKAENEAKNALKVVESIQTAE